MNIVEEYDRRSLYPTLLKCYHYLHPMAKCKVHHVDQTTYANFDLDIFEQTPITSEPWIKIVTKEMLIFKCYQVAPKKIKWPL